MGAGESNEVRHDSAMLSFIGVPRWCGDRTTPQEAEKKREDEKRRREEKTRREDEKRRREEKTRREDEKRRREEKTRREDEKRRREEKTRREEEENRRECAASFTMAATERAKNSLILAYLHVVGTRSCLHEGQTEGSGSIYIHLRRFLEHGGI
ncbi:hypothetical protein IWX47DRAFT_849183 [Phyllosticta citricarpa]